MTKLRLHAPAREPHQCLVEYIDQVQEQLEKLVETICGGTDAEVRTEEHAALLDNYAVTMSRLCDLRAAAFDHAWVAGTLHWSAGGK